MSIRSYWLTVGGGLSLIASLLHFACIPGGPSWYRFMGAGERMARAAEMRQVRPALITAGIGAILAVWAAYAFSGAGLIARLPLLRTALLVITAIYLLRGMVVFKPSLLGRPDLSAGFLLWSSLAVLAIGLTYGVGTWLAWPTL